MQGDGKQLEAQIGAAEARLRRIMDAGMASMRRGMDGEVRIEAGADCSEDCIVSEDATLVQRWICDGCWGRECRRRAGVCCLLARNLKPVLD